jgi:hypothetical protein
MTTATIIGNESDGWIVITSDADGNVSQQQFPPGPQPE